MGHDKDIELPNVTGQEFSGIVMSVGQNVKDFQIVNRVTSIIIK